MPEKNTWSGTNISVDLLWIFFTQEYKFLLRRGIFFLFFASNYISLVIITFHGLLLSAWPDLAKFRHFGYFLRLVANFFLVKVA